MGKLLFYGAISLDGYLADKNDQLEWLFTTDTGEKTTYDDFYKTIDTNVMGRVTYEECKKLLDNQPIFPEKNNYVFSKTLSDSLSDATVVSEDPVNFLKELKQAGHTIWFVGGGNLLLPLLEADLIDEWYIQIAPVVLGEGKRLFENGTYQQRLEFVETKQMGELVELHYRKKNLPQ